MKSKFNKPDTVYPHGSLREQPEWEEPQEWNYNFMKDADKIANFEHVRFEQDKRAYKKHIESLKVIPCSENNWKDGQELEEGKDYKLINQNWPKDELKNKELLILNFGERKEFPTWIAVPIVQETEDLMYELTHYYWHEHLFKDRPQSEVLTELKSQFTIQRRKQ